MKLYSEFNLGDTYYELSKCRLVDPLTLTVSDKGLYFDIDSTVAQTLNKNLGLKSCAFSKSFHSLDPDLWTARYEKAQNFEKVANYVKDSAVMVCDSQVVSVLDANQSSYFTKFISTLDDLNKNSDLKIYYNYSTQNKEFVAIINSETEKCGYVVSYDIPRMQLKSYPIVQFEDGGYISPNAICDIKITSSDFATLLDPDVSLMQSKLTMEGELEEFNQNSLPQMSLRELGYNLKIDYGIKLSADKSQLSDVEVEDYISEILDKLYESASAKYLHSSLLTKSLVPAPTTYHSYYVNLINKFLIDQIGLARVVEFSGYIFKGSTDAESVSISKEG